MNEPLAPHTTEVETWIIELGNDAQVIRKLVTTGTSLAAVRMAKKELRREWHGEKFVDVFRPGCRVFRRFNKEDV